MNNVKKGFTLIELLVVIAIIGLLSSVALASLANARAKAADANIQGALASARSQAELFFSTNNDYGPENTSTNCSSLTAGSIFQADTKFNAIINSAIVSSGSAATAAYCHSSDNSGFGTSDAVSWMVIVRLRTNNQFGWCVDSSGNSRRVSTATAIIFLDGNPAICPSAA